jgi:hypothetical protein
MVPHVRRDQSSPYMKAHGHVVTVASRHDLMHGMGEFPLPAVRVRFDTPRKNVAAWSRTMTTQATPQGHGISSTNGSPYEPDFRDEKQKKPNGYKAPLREIVPRHEQKNTGNYVIASTT